MSAAGRECGLPDVKRILDVFVSHADAERLKVQAENVLTATIKRREEQAVERIAQAEATAIKDVRDQAIELAIGVATKIITEKMTKTVQNELVKDASEDLIKKFQH